MDTERIYYDCIRFAKKYGGQFEPD